MEDFQKNIFKVRIFSNTVIFQVIAKVFFKVTYVKRAIISIKLCFSISLCSRKLGNFNKIPEMLGFDGEYPAVHPKAKF